MRIFTSLILALLCAGCQTTLYQGSALDQSPPIPSTLCRGSASEANSAICAILVKVTPNGAGCNVDLLDPALSTVIFKLGKPVWTFWILDPSSTDYRFESDDGIQFSLDPLRNFTNRGLAGPQGKVFAVRNNNSTFWGASPQGGFKYTINVEGPNGRKCLLDPWYRNQ